MPGARVAEFYCRNMPAKLLGNLSIIPAERCNHAYIKSALLKSFEDLEVEATRAGISDRCAASVALVVGDVLFTAVLGCCTAMLCQRQEKQSKSGALGYAPAKIGGKHGPGRSAAKVSAAAANELEKIPEVSSVQLMNGASDAFFVLAGAPVAEVMMPHDLTSVAVNYISRPRAASGGIAARAVEKLRQSDPQTVRDCAAIVAYTAPSGEVSQPGPLDVPAAKRARVDNQSLQSVRLRHILVRHKDAKHPLDPVKNRVATRTRAEAEAVLRETLEELLKDGDHRGDTMWAAKSTPRIISLCRSTSECKSALKGGSTCGDLGWLGKKELQALGKDAEEAIRNLAIAEWSDLLSSEQGIHLIMRIA